MSRREHLRWGSMMQDGVGVTSGHNFARRLSGPPGQEGSAKLTVTCQRCHDRVFFVEVRTSPFARERQALILDALLAQATAEAVLTSDSSQGTTYTYGCSRCGRSGIQFSSARLTQELLAVWAEVESDGRSRTRNISG